MNNSINNKKEEEEKSAVTRLLEIANANTGGSAAAAYTLLSAYNSYDYALPIAELGRLDIRSMKAVQMVIGMRYHGTEPHEYIANGSKTFERLCAAFSPNVARSQ